MKVRVYTICKNEAYLMPFWLRHYSSFADEIIVYDENSTDGTADLVRACPKARLMRWPFAGLDDDRFRLAWSGFVSQSRGRADWVLLPDVDELLWAPNARQVLARRLAEGYRLLTAWGINLVPDAPPKDDGRSQFYELAPLGVEAPNYRKSIIVNPSESIEYDFGRHHIRRFQGSQCPDVDFMLYHCHFLGVEHTRARNKRNYDAALNKKFAWNYDAQHNEDPNQVGSVAWVERVIRDGLRVRAYPPLP